jgi:sugar phosphate isomerase/epimerase
MRVGGAHLGYCTNIHAGEAWAEVEAVKRRVCPDEPFGVGLRLSARAARELAPQVGRVRAWLDAHGLYVFTINGFPYGDFHGTRVKEAVYLPDWLDDRRVEYTVLLGTILGRLLPSGVSGSISTVPGCFRARGVDEQRIADNLRRALDGLGDIALALEPEPACLLETTREGVDFIDRHRLGASLCVDACHAAVEFEDVAALPFAAKVQLSCGLRVTRFDAAARTELARFADDVYLHQVVARRGDGTLARYLDLPDALANEHESEEWRVHCHVPIFREALGAFHSTQPYLAAVIARRLAPHLEVETYTWDVLPPELRAEPIEDAIARELAWVKEQLA